MKNQAVLQNHTPGQQHKVYHPLPSPEVGESALAWNLLGWEKKGECELGFPEPKGRKESWGEKLC